MVADLFSSKVEFRTWNIFNGWNIAVSFFFFQQSSHIPIFLACLKMIGIYCVLYSYEVSEDGTWSMDTRGMRDFTVLERSLAWLAPTAGDSGTCSETQLLYTTLGIKRLVCDDRWNLVVLRIFGRTEGVGYSFRFVLGAVLVVALIIIFGESSSHPSSICCVWNVLII